MERLRKKKGRGKDLEEVRKLFEDRKKEAEAQYFGRRLDELKRTDKRGFHNELSKLMKEGGERKSNTPTEIPIMRGQSDTVKAHMVADYIENLTANYKRINATELAKRYPGGVTRRLEYSEVVLAFKNSKLPYGLHPSDPPRKILQCLPDRLAVPLTYIYNNILSTCIWPEKWKSESTRPIPKKTTPLLTKDYRPIAITSYYSKVLELIVRDDILHDVGPNMHIQQYGGQKLVSCDTYLLGLYEDLYKAKDEGQISLVICLDYSAAFNSLNHEDVIKATENLGLRRPLVRLLCSYLANRTTEVLWGQGKSSPRLSKGGSGQGTLLSVVLFLIAVNFILVKLETEMRAREKNFSDDVTISSGKRYYVDDLQIQINLSRKSLLEINGEKIFQDDGRINSYMHIIESISNATGMRLNASKTVVLASNAQGIYFPPYTTPEGEKWSRSIMLESGTVLKVEDKVKLLGVTIDEEFKFDSAVNERRSAGFKAMWQLCRLAARGVKQKHLIEAYTLYVRSALEYSLISSYPCLSTEQIGRLESVQRRATRYIMGMAPFRRKGEIWYEDRCERLGLESIKSRMKANFEKLTLKDEFEPRLQQYFKLRPPDPSERAVRRRRPYMEKKWKKITTATKAPISNMISKINKKQSIIQERKTEYNKLLEQKMSKNMSKAEHRCIPVRHEYQRRNQ